MEILNYLLYRRAEKKQHHLGLGKYVFTETLPTEYNDKAAKRRRNKRQMHNNDHIIIAIIL